MVLRYLMHRHKLATLFLGLFWLGLLQPLSGQNITYEDFFVESTDKVKLFVRAFTNTQAVPKYKYPLLLLHGGGPGVLASVDNEVPEGSFVKDLIRAGFKVYMMNARGWEQSTLPTYDAQDTTLLIGNYKEVATDIDHVIEAIRKREKVKQVSLFGWATGGHWGGYYATKHSKKLAHFISLNSLYGVKAPWELRKFFWKEEDTTQFQRTQPYRVSGREGLVRKWHATIPVANKQLWRDSLVMEHYRNTAVSFGEDTTQMKVPGGYREESFYMSLGKQYWSARQITTPTLVIRTELDFWSRPEDIKAINDDLPSTARKRVITLPGTHYVFLDKPERGRKQLVEAIVNFIEEK